jgi:hypothetical protein
VKNGPPTAPSRRFLRIQVLHALIV